MGERLQLSPNDVQNIARYQKGLLSCIVANLLVQALLFTLRSETWLLVMLAAIPIAITSVVLVFLLANKVYGTGLGILLGILVLIPIVALRMPIVGLIFLVIVNGKATRVLRQHGIHVGLFGAKMSDVAALPPAAP